MVKTISTENMRRDEWLKLRKTGIGGSDAGAICGLNPYASPMSVYQDKITEHISLEDNESMRQGRDLEDYVARRFMEVTGLKVRRSNVMYRSQEYPFMIADVDRLIVGENAGLECKTASPYSSDKWKDGEIPPHYLIQCYHYMLVTGKKEWYIAVLIFGQEFKYAKIKWDESMIQDLIAIETDFWNNHVVPEIMPEPDGSEASEAVLNEYFRTAKSNSSIPLIGFDEKLGRREEIIGLMKKLEQEQKQIEQEIKLYMKENETAFNEKYRITWTNVDTARLDTKRIKTERPEIYNDFVNVTNSRRFLVKAA
ncbi:YqaJ viral recombinase family protein [Lacrimispora sp.]|uniref:YqaJ viral recombinase family nuclease n=1 Tax=Lacrimispora sp. TaxID=2719234 RepID=UPI00345FCC60